MAIIIFSGPDRVGKSTQLLNLKRYLEEKRKLYHVLHYSNIKGDNIEERSKQYYNEMFKLIKFATYNSLNLMLDRAHDGELVYSPIYRGYSGEYVFDIEESFGKRVLNNCILYLFTANPETLIERDDGESFSTELEKKIDEIDRFKDFFNKSKIINKHHIDITNKDIDAVFNDVKWCFDQYNFS